MRESRPSIKEAGQIADASNAIIAEPPFRRNRHNPRWVVALTLAISALTLLAGCGARPTHDQGVLAAIRAEADTLMSERQTQVAMDVPRSQWPRAIAHLRPESVTIAPEGADINVKPYFDGGWGYFVPRNAGEAPDPVGRFSALGQGVYWYRPY